MHLPVIKLVPAASFMEHSWHTSKGTIADVATLTFEQARQCVLKELRASQPEPKIELVSLSEAAGRVLAEPVAADRDYPALARSVRDGFAVRAADLPGDLFVIGEVRAGESFAGEVQPGQALEIMTGAPLPRGADSVVMVEHCTVAGERVTVPRTLAPGENVSPQASQARENEVLLEAGQRLGFAEIALLAMVGSTSVPVYARPQVAILATGDEIVEVERNPAGLPDPQFERGVPGGSSEARRRMPHHSADCAGPVPGYARVDRTRAALRHAAALRRRLGRQVRHRGDACWRTWAPSSISIAS